MIDNIKNEEGFSGYQYDDHLGNPTIGYGTKLPLTEEEATMLLVSRLNDNINIFANLWPHYNEMKPEIKDILSEMVYQLGPHGVYGFKNMLTALEVFNYVEAAKEGRDSKWYRQTPSRAERLMTRMENV